MLPDLTLDILRQPTDETCGPTCLHAVYRFYGRDLDLDLLIEEVGLLRTGGTLAAYLGAHALRCGDRATIYTYNLELFDPTWFQEADPDLEARLRRQVEVKEGGRIGIATEAYLDFLGAGGQVRFTELGPDLLRELLQQGRPVMAGLSATYLYDCARERWEDGHSVDDPLRGSPTGHFVVLHGFDPATDSVLVADPYHDNPFEGSNYRVGMWRLLGAIMLGVVTYDGNLLVIEPGAST